MAAETQPLIRTMPSSRPPGAAPALVHTLCLALASGALLTLFLAVRSLTAAHPELASGPAAGLASNADLALLLGLAALLLAGASVFAGLLRPLRRADWIVGELAQALERHRHRDELTGALNRTAFDQMIGGALEGLRRYGTGFCGIMAEARGFQRLCEEAGYEAGDRALAELARLLRANLRKADSLFRWRSGSFLILAPGIGRDQALLLAAKLESLAAERELSGGARLPLCLGVVQARTGDTPESFSTRALASLEQPCPTKTTPDRTAS